MKIKSQGFYFSIIDRDIGRTSKSPPLVDTIILTKNL